MQTETTVLVLMDEPSVEADITARMTGELSLGEKGEGLVSMTLLRGSNTATFGKTFRTGKKTSDSEPPYLIERLFFRGHT